MRSFDEHWDRHWWGWGRYEREEEKKTLWKIETNAIWMTVLLLLRLDSWCLSFSLFLSRSFLSSLGLLFGWKGSKLNVAGMKRNVRFNLYDTHFWTNTRNPSVCLFVHFFSWLYYDIIFILHASYIRQREEGESFPSKFSRQSAKIYILVLLLDSANLCLRKLFSFLHRPWQSGEGKGQQIPVSEPKGEEKEVRKRETRRQTVLSTDMTQDLG